MEFVVKILEEIQSEWTSKQESLRKAGLSRKETQKVHVDQRKFAILERLKQVGGPFCSTEEIDTFLNNYKGDKGQSQKRMRDEITYARHTSTSFPRQHHLFKIMSTDPMAKKRRIKSPEEFAESLKILLGNASQRTSLTLDDIRKALCT